MDKTYHVIAERGEQQLVSTTVPPAEPEDLFPCFIYDSVANVLFEAELFSALGQGYWEAVPEGTTLTTGLRPQEMR